MILNLKYLISHFLLEMLLAPLHMFFADKGEYLASTICLGPIVASAAVRSIAEILLMLIGCLLVIAMCLGPHQN